MSESERYPAPPDAFPEKESNGHGTDHGYTVQARMAYIEPKVICGHLLDTRWKTLYFEQSPIGVPTHPRYSPWSGSLPGVMCYQAAQALRWWFLANAAHSFDHLCIETRIIEHKVEYSYSSTAVRAGAVIAGRDLLGMAQPPSLPDAVGQQHNP